MRTTPHFHTNAGRGLDEEGEKGRGDALPFYYCLATHPLIVHYYNCYSVPLTSTSLLVRMLPLVYLSSTLPMQILRLVREQQEFRVTFNAYAQSSRVKTKRESSVSYAAAAVTALQ
mmetsp:Transcript_10653/g.27890  ORF Transcript_10653/g.27890 Transcript_10653/m.27890 type:complete len:116 (+) Transcript_10653:739-1086(+)